MNKNFFKKNKIVITVLLLTVSILLIHNIKPSFLYDRDKSIRQFGLGLKSKTIIPLWLVVIILSILFYLMVDYYIKYY